jgi:hypothetical protein
VTVGSAGGVPSVAQITAPKAGSSSPSQKRARAKRRQALQRERRRNTAQLQSGVTCADLGQTDILVVPGASIDGDGDGIGCES